MWAGPGPWRGFDEAGELDHQVIGPASGKTGAFLRWIDVGRIAFEVSVLAHAGAPAEDDAER